MSTRQKYIIVLLVLLISVFDVLAAERFFTGGVNVSHFCNAISKPLPGFSLGLGWEWKIGRSSTLLFGPSYLYKGAKLENKTVWDQSSTLFEEDIWCRIGYLDLPFCYRQYNRNNSSYLTAGISFSFAIHDGSNMKILKESRIFAHHVKSDYAVNIDRSPGYILNSSSLDFILGGGIRIKQISVGGFAKISVGRVGTVLDIGHINARFISYSVLGSWYF